MSTPNQPGDPSWEPLGGWQPQGYGSPQSPQNPPSYPGYPTPPPYPGYPSYAGHPGSVDPQAPFGRDPATGVPLSDKSASTAGLLQLFLGVFGIGRFYIDSTQIAIAQLCLGMFGVVFSVFCFLGIPVLLGSIVWAVVDAIMMFTGNVKDNYGRKLR
ncbi:MAG TPA: TM2 domain-containing protein [Mycobacterium sp.]|nr:TM2 domain-containing protein [Mycobacterium sp.]HTX94328.1 TM2 domain-containing protein [Mycobacterium sp.]